MLQIRGLPAGSMGGLLCRHRRNIPDDRCHVFLSICDHFEPMVGAAGRQVQDERVQRWVTEFPRSVQGLSDCRGQSPQHTFFYPAEEYVPEHLDRLANLCHRGYGDVEVHLHHDRDTAEHLRETLLTFKHRLFFKHGLLARNQSNEITYGFIHGNWALCNSRPDGRWCGVANELEILRETGCYADFTMPSAPCATQTRTINRIYYGCDRPGRNKSHDTGTRSCVGQPAPSKGLLMVQGPLMLDWHQRKWHLLPRLENGELSGANSPTLDRFKLWLAAGIGVQQQPRWIFIKLHTHGALERNSEMLLGVRMRQFHESLAELAREHSGLRYYYVTAREMADLVHQAEQGAETPRFHSVRSARASCRSLGQPHRHAVPSPGCS